MKVRLFPMIMALLIYANGSAQVTYERKVQLHRDSIDIAFADPETTILDLKDQGGFHGISYFPIDVKYQLSAKFKPIKNADTLRMKTSGTRTPLFRPYGTLTFKLDKKKFKLTLYQSADPSKPAMSNYLLLAFTDRTSGVETYGGGRYLEFDTSEVQKRMTVDFNYCFNPYCAYNHKYSCVIPPQENDMDIRIEAGPKKFHD